MTDATHPTLSGRNGIDGVGKSYRKCNNAPCPDVMFPVLINKSQSVTAGGGIYANNADMLGGALAIVSGGDPDVLIQLKDWNGQLSEPFPARQGTVIPGPFKNIYVTIPAGLSGTLEVWITPCVQDAMALVQEKLPEETVTTVRSAAILTTGYVAGTVLEGLRDQGFNVLTLGVTFTIGSLTDVRIKIEWSDDDSTYFQQVTNTVAAGTETLSASEYILAATMTIVIHVPIQANYCKISAKGTGTVTSSSLAVRAILGRN